MFSGFSLAGGVRKKPAAAAVVASAFALDDTPLKLTTLNDEPPVAAKKLKPPEASIAPPAAPTVAPATNAAATSSIAAQSGAGTAADEPDALDAFMETNTRELERAAAAPPSSGPATGPDELAADDDDLADDVPAPRRRPGADEPGYDSDEEVYRAAEAADAAQPAGPPDPGAKREIALLPAVDHSLEDYQPFEKDLYEPHPAVAALSDADVRALRQSLQLHVTGAGRLPAPVASFEQLTATFPAPLLAAIARAGFAHPTPIQQQAVPVACSGRDLIAAAKTGSGKTAAYVWPLLVHLMAQDELPRGEGPIALVCAPTRELVLQITAEARRFGKPFGVRVSAVYGGAPKMEQWKELRQGSDVVVATPGRLLELIKMKGLALRRCTLLVLDEADRLLDLGFEPQLRSVAGQLRPDRQTLLFSATFKPVVERLARELLTDPVRIVVGQLGQANADVRQEVQVLPGPNADDAKWAWLRANLPALAAAGSVIIFVAQKGAAELLTSRITAQLGLPVAALHGDKDQAERTKALYAFRHNNVRVLVATDVAARGLDIPQVRAVVEYEPPRNIDGHTHRIGRTGRAGLAGQAFVLLSEHDPTNKDAAFAGDLVRAYELQGVPVAPPLLQLAMTHPRFRKQRDRLGIGRRGRGGSATAGPGPSVGPPGRGRGRRAIGSDGGGDSEMAGVAAAHAAAVAAAAGAGAAGRGPLGFVRASSSESGPSKASVVLPPSLSAAAKAPVVTPPAAMSAEQDAFARQFQANLQKMQQASPAPQAPPAGKRRWDQT